MPLLTNPFRENPAVSTDYVAA